MTRVLVVEDDADIAQLLVHYLDKAGFSTEVVTNGRDALAVIAARPPDLLVLDLMLPQVDGLEVCRLTRSNEATAAIPIIMLTARAEESDRIVGLELGADDYLAKPFSPNELVARVRALLRRANAHRRQPGSAIAYGSIAVDSGQHTVSVAGDEVTLTAKEFLLLEYLLQHRGRVLSRDLLLTDVWGYRYTGGTRTVDVHVRRLREKLPLLATALVTVKQFGYKLLEAPDMSPDERLPTDRLLTAHVFQLSDQAVRRRPDVGGDRAGGRRRAVRDHHGAAQRRANRTDAHRRSAARGRSPGARDAGL